VTCFSPMDVNDACLVFANSSSSHHVPFEAYWVEMVSLRPIPFLPTLSETRLSFHGRSGLASGTIKVHFGPGKLLADRCIVRGIDERWRRTAFTTNVQGVLDSQTYEDFSYLSPSS
jgi:hypothetical protein